MKIIKNLKLSSLLILILFFQTALCQNDTILNIPSTKNLTNNQNKISSKLKVGIIAGASIYTVDFNSLDKTYSYLEKNNHVSNISPLIGLKIVYTPMRTKNWSLATDFIYNSQYYEGTFVEYTNENYYNLLDYSFGVSAIMMNSIVKYTVQNEIFKPYVGAGICLSATFEEKNHLTQNFHKYDEIQITDQELFVDWKNSLLYGLNFEMGMDYKNYSLGIRYTVVDFGSTKELNAINHSFKFIVAYVF